MLPAAASCGFMPSQLGAVASHREVARRPELAYSSEVLISFLVLLEETYIAASFLWMNPRTNLPACYLSFHLFVNANVIFEP